MKNLIKWDKNTRNNKYKIMCYILVGVTLCDKNYESFIYGIPETMFSTEYNFNNWVKENNYVTLNDKIQFPLLNKENKIIRLLWVDKEDQTSEFLINDIIYAYGYYKPKKFEIKFLNEFGKKVYKLYLDLHLELLKKQIK